MDLLNEIGDIFSKIMAFKQNSNKLVDLLFKRGVLQHLENPP